MARLNLPSEDATNGGSEQSENEAPPQEQRIPGVRSPITQGPNVGPAGEYLPAAYRKTRRLPNGKTREVVREDR